MVGFGAVTTLTATTLCSLLGQPRIFFQMARDGLLFRAFGRVSRKRHVPVFGTLFTGVGAALLGTAMSIDEV
jgi:APA family basic amino acid/polyamine antiporter